ncbi:flagellar basal body P-ring formation chaperone FlgA [Desulfuromonas sp.]|uniref:flagellar basal body P-ring formation chaperone FlgA n=1 Tax=Desulfuromonas sp. TaxID=892 RepID=UPI0025BB40B5|nr:flagellar basal body P-ring formation chaperone FlgA [Desulfuromonas sp.]
MPRIALFALFLSLAGSVALGQEVRLTKIAGAGGGDTRIGPDRIEQILQAYLEEHREELPPASVRFRSLTLPDPFTLPAGRLSTQVIPSDPAILGSRRFTLIFRVDGRVVKNLSLRAELEALAPVVVAASDLRRGAELSRDDIVLSERNLVDLREPCFDPEELLGKRLRRSVRAGVPVSRGTVEFPPMVRRGETITISAARGALRLTALGEARQDGREGEFVRVRNNSSRKEIQCRVVAPGLAEVEF